MGVPYMGDYDTTETVPIPFNTFTSDDPSASCTITNLAAGDVEIHKDGSTTQRASDNGVTVSIDFDSTTGNHLVTIDLSDNSDAGFYAAGSRYQVRMEGTTIDGATVNAWIGAFSIGCTLRPTTAGRTLDVASTGEAGLDFDNIKDATGAHTLTNITVPTVTDVSNGVSLANGAITDASLAGALETVFETDFATNYNSTRKAWVTNAQDFVGTTASDPFNGKIVSASVTDSTAQTGDAFARLGAPAGASVSADIAAVKSETASILDDTDLIDDGTSGLAKIATDVAAILVDTGTTIPGTITTAQADLDTITGADGVKLATAQANYAPAKAGDKMDLLDTIMEDA